jgi:hypothetical protein
MIFWGRAFALSEVSQTSAALSLVTHVDPTHESLSYIAKVWLYKQSLFLLFDAHAVLVVCQVVQGIVEDGVLIAHLRHVFHFAFADQIPNSKLKTNASAGCKRCAENQVDIRPRKRKGQKASIVIAIRVGVQT